MHTSTTRLQLGLITSRSDRSLGQEDICRARNLRQKAPIHKKRGPLGLDRAPAFVSDANRAYDEEKQALISNT